MRTKGFSFLAWGLAALAGAAMAVQGTINAALSKAVGLIESTFIVHLTGLAASLILLGAYFLSTGHTRLASLGQAPWYAFLGGVLGVLIIFGVAASIPKLGVGNATTAIITAQLFTAFLIDCFGWLGAKQIPFHWLKLVGLILIGTGARLIFCS